MAALIRTPWVGLLLALLPAALHRALDDWSYRVARRKAERRRSQALQRQAARS